MKDEEKTKEQLIEEINELRRQRSEDRYRDFVELSQNLIFECGSEGQFTYLNPAWTRLLGYQKDEMLSHHFSEFKLPASAATDKRAFNKILKGKDTFGYDTIYVTKSGEPKHLLFNARLRKDDKGTVIGTQGIAHDITERRQAEKALRDSEEKYEDLYDNAPDMFVSVEASTGNISQCNQTLANTLNYTKDEIIGHHISEVYHPDCEDERKKVFKAFVEKGKIRNEELQLKRKDGSKIEVSLNISAVSDEQGKVLYSRSIWRDITSQKNLEKKLRQSSKMEALGTLAGGIAHDFNNILASVLGNAELMMMELQEESQEKLYLESIIEGGERAANLVKQILTFSRMESARFRPVNLASIVEDALKIARATIPSNIGICQTLQDDCANIMANVTQMHQVVLNLCTNAYHAMKETEGTIDVTLKEMKGSDLHRLSENRGMFICFQD